MLLPGNFSWEDALALLTPLVDCEVPTVNEDGSLGGEPCLAELAEVFAFFAAEDVATKNVRHE